MKFLPRKKNLLYKSKLIMKKIMLLAVIAAFTLVSALQAGDNPPPAQAACPRCTGAQGSTVGKKVSTSDKNKSQCPTAKTGDNKEAVKSCCPVTAKASQTAASRCGWSYAKQAQR
jgi:hypothetical protein